jgi:CPA2 family monovalent cation:H+ antiporter-2
MEEDFEEAGSDVLLIGFGRFGQIVAQVLLAKRINVTILEANAERIREAKKFGFRIYFGDGRRPDVLRSAGAHKAKICIICTDKKATTTAIVKTMQKTCAHVKILARSYDRGHTLELVGLGVHAEVRETLGSALELGMLSLEELGLDHNEAEAIMENVLERDLERLKIQKTQGFYAGLDIMHKAAPVQPEPLTRVRRKSSRLRRKQRPSLRRQMAWILAKGKLPNSCHRGCS